jgi:hypothetical protein
MRRLVLGVPGLEHRHQLLHQSIQGPPEGQVREVREGRVQDLQRLLDAVERGGGQDLVELHPAVRLGGDLMLDELELV